LADVVIEARTRANPMKLVITMWRGDEARLGRRAGLLATLATASTLLTGCVLFIPDVHDLRLGDRDPSSIARPMLSSWESQRMIGRRII
jgi:hypothetical protein